MKKYIYATSAVLLMAPTALAGGWAEPVYPPEVPFGVRPKPRPPQCLGVRMSQHPPYELLYTYDTCGVDTDDEGPGERPRLERPDTPPGNTPEPEKPAPEPEKPAPEPEKPAPEPEPEKPAPEKPKHDPCACGNGWNRGQEGKA